MWHETVREYLKFLLKILSNIMKLNPLYQERFDVRHNAPDNQQISEMLKMVKADSLEHLIDETIPKAIQLKKDLNLPEAQTEFEFLESFKEIAQKNQIFRSYIGLGYYNTHTPGVIQRNILENPGWYTAYTPYQAEIAQGRLEALINFQTMVIDLTGMEIANASLLDEGTAAAEAMSMFYGLRKGKKKSATVFFVDENTFPQTVDILKTRANPMGIELRFADLSQLDVTDPDIFGFYAQQINLKGEVIDLKPIIEAATENNIHSTIGADLLALTLLTPPGEMGADCVVGTSQRFGIPMGYGGPHAAYFATKEAYKRQVPGRIIGVSVDKEGNKAYRMALQTREQHIKKEKATSNICTAQVLLAIMSGMFGVYHGPVGLKKIAVRTHSLTKLLANGLTTLGYEVTNKNFFDTITVQLESEKLREKLHSILYERKINLNLTGTHTVSIALNETTRIHDIKELIEIFALVVDEDANKYSVEDKVDSLELDWPKQLIRESRFMEHPIFNQFHAEHEMLRYIKRLENKDLSLVHSMISLGSCTMKLNATAEMIPITWPEMAHIHPYAPKEQALGYREMFIKLENMLTEITGFAATSLQPNSGAQGEYAGLMVIRAYHQSRGDEHRNVTIVPSSAHGTNPASAVMAGMKVVITKCDDQGNIDLEDLKEKAEEYKNNLAALMVTYPSTHGVFEESIQEICQIVHDNGGQVYMDGANMNAQVGLTSPANIGADVCHLNLHKTFCIPHGGGGPGMGPICVAEHLEDFLPGNPLVPTGGNQAITAISAAPWGSASILAISYAYISMMGSQGLKKATQLAILNANYIKEKLAGSYPVLYTNQKGRAAHEMIIDCRAFKEFGVEVEDIAKRLMDYGYHSPTVSFPVPGTMMIEPTESESKMELDKFCTAMISIRKEIQEIADGKADTQQNVLKNAPHTMSVALAEKWELPYSREKAVFPLESVRQSKFWPSVSRIDSAYGDRNLMCSCIPVSEYEDKPEEAMA
ncbi:glycine dehydrogenase (aminomethyl-transferring) [Marivirga tractuosa]|uniref:Glycine dehydrogenase (decarboxylating) n=2 Tax=Marivirga TaxID=869806 RepID=E4TTS7_MARTH|nr:glycine dehydrogenase (decarboxylating) beta subunit; glycine dehydrogenase (decarboxylating) alpha subunit [Marivirga tractuosa DSM 4126]BDD13558.1 glycine dehydrogenase (aminomethyl-transferring) [Marivirga tractuosa]